MKTIALNVWERIVALSILPNDGNFARLRMIQELQRKLGIPAEEMERIEMVVDEQGMARWNREKESGPVSLEFQDKEFELIRDTLEKLNSQNKLEMRMLSLCEKFIEVK